MDKSLSVVGSKAERDTHEANFLASHRGPSSGGSPRAGRGDLHQPGRCGRPPEVNVGDVTISEGDGGISNTAKFAVTLSDPVATDTIVQWSITPGSATAGSDYMALKKPKLTKIKAGKTAAFASVKVLPDTAAEGDESFSVTLSAVTRVPRCSDRIPPERGRSSMTTARATRP